MLILCAVAVRVPIATFLDIHDNFKWGEEGSQNYLKDGKQILNKDKYAHFVTDIISIF